MKDTDTFNMIRLREKVKGGDLLQAVSAVDQAARIARKRGRVTGDVHQLLRFEREQRIQRLARSYSMLSGVNEAVVRLVRETGYLSFGPGPVVRVRRAGPDAFVTVKGDGLIARPEFEYPIPVEDADAMLADLCHKPLVEKTRHEVRHAGLLWHVDEFGGGNDGLVVLG